MARGREGEREGREVKIDGWREMGKTLKRDSVSDSKCTQVSFS